MKPRPLALCITELEVGGAEKCLVELAIRLDRARFSPTVYCLAAEPTPERSQLAERLRQAGVDTHFLGGRSVVSFPKVLRRLTALFRAQRPELVQTFLFHANFVGALAARRAGVPKVVWGIRVAEREHRWHLRLARWTSGRVDRHVCVSQAVAEFSHIHGKLPRERLAVIPNGVDLKRFAQAPAADLTALGVPQGQSVLVFIGRLDAQKGLPWLLKAAPYLLERAPRHDLLIVGEGKQRDTLHKLCVRLNIAERVHFAGWRDDIPNILAASDLLVLPSRWEGMPNVLLEAMAAGKPVVATDAEGVSEILGPMACDQLVPRDDSQAFITRTAAILRDHQLAAELGGANRAHVAAHFSLERMENRYEELYEELLSQ